MISIILSKSRYWASKGMRRAHQPCGTGHQSYYLENAKKTPHGRSAIEYENLTCGSSLKCLYRHCVQTSTSTGAKQFILLNAKFNLAKVTTVE